MKPEEVSRAVKSQYIMDNAWQHAHRRLALLEAEQDPGTIRHLESLGVGPGWHCLEVAAGAGSIAAWLCRRVGPSGRVVATDVDTRFLEALAAPNLEVLRHDIVADELLPYRFDLVHTRNLLFHLAGRQQALERLVALVKPGGWLLVEEADYCSLAPDPYTKPAVAALFARARAAEDAMTARTGRDTTYGRRLYADVCAFPLVDVGAEGRVRMVRGGSHAAQFWRLSWEQIRERLLTAGLLTEQDYEGYVALLNTPAFVFMDYTQMAVWGRRPPG